MAQAYPDQTEAPGAAGRPYRPPHPGSAGAHRPEHRPPPTAHRGLATSTATTGYAAAGVPDVTELLLRAGEGDPAAWDEIVHRYSAVVVGRVRSFRLQDADTLDAIQMTWLRLTENSHQIQHPEHLGGWLATTATRECLHILRQTKRTAYRADAIVENIADPAVGAEQRVLDAETAQTLRTLIAELPPRRQTLLRALFADARRPYADISRTTGIPVGSMGPTLTRALKQLRLMLNEQGLGSGDRR